MRTPNRANDSNLRLADLKRKAGQLTLAFILVFLGMGFFNMTEQAQRFFPLVFVVLGLYTGINGLVAYKAGFTGLKALDARPNLVRLLGVVWMFVACFIVILGVRFVLNNFTGAAG